MLRGARPDYRRSPMRRVLIGLVLGLVLAAAVPAVAGAVITASITNRTLTIAGSTGDDDIRLRDGLVDACPDGGPDADVFDLDLVDQRLTLGNGLTVLRCIFPRVNLNAALLDRLGAKTSILVVRPRG